MRRVIRFAQGWLVLSLLWSGLITIAVWDQVKENFVVSRSETFTEERWSRIAHLIQEECKATLSSNADVSDNFRRRCLLFSKDYIFYASALAEERRNSWSRQYRIFVVVLGPPLFFGLLGMIIVSGFAFLRRHDPPADEF